MKLVKQSRKLPTHEAQTRTPAILKRTTAPHREGKPTRGRTSDPVGRDERTGSVATGGGVGQGEAGQAMTPTMTKQLYRVTIELSYFALADSPEDAKDHVSEAINDAGTYGMTIDADVCSEARDVWGHEKGELVYHDGREDISIEQAFELSTGKNFVEAKIQEAAEFRAKTPKLSNDTNI
jgi:hypothetical protein